MLKLNLERPLIFFDLETTGTNITSDRIVELSYIKIHPDGREERESLRINPGIKIPAESTAVHHISDEDVKDAPHFSEKADHLNSVFENCDLAGFNSNKFDIPLLMEEFARCRINFQLSGRRLIDVQNIFHKMEQRTLVAAYKFYCGKELTGAHSAMADTEATYEVLLNQIEKYDELDNNIASLSKFSTLGRNIDLAARFILNDKDEPIFNFGKYKGTKVTDIFRKDPSYYNWMLEGDFSKNTKDELIKMKVKYDKENNSRKN